MKELIIHLLLGMERESQTIVPLLVATCIWKPMELFRKSCGTAIVYWPRLTFTDYRNIGQNNIIFIQLGRLFFIEYRTFLLL
jgi:hypothetical protein